MNITVEDLKFELAERQYRMFLTRMSEIVEANMLVAATNIAADKGCSLAEAIEVCVHAMHDIRELKRDLREQVVAI